MQQVLILFGFTLQMQRFQQLSFPAKKSKRIRSAFTTEQINYLENEFKKSHYISAVQRKEIANIVNVPEKVIKIWFQNRRMKEKKELCLIDNYEEDESSQNIPFVQDPSSYASTSTQDASVSLPLMSNTVETIPQPGTSKQIDDLNKSYDKDNEEQFLITNEGSTLFPYYIDLSKKNEHIKQNYPEKANMKATGNITKSINHNRENPLDLSLKNSVVENQGDITATADSPRIFLIDSQSYMPPKNVIDKPVIPSLGQDIPASTSKTCNEKGDSEKKRCCKCKKNGISWPVLFHTNSTNSQFILAAIEIPNPNPPK
ncbi:homeobox protein SMOX-3-like [Bombyx mandarina]|uniref:Homeobox protein SMOX-3-like n=1 Tax=Bombyx mandarina TaxID=7092 RepID=A0A6J2JAE5_BOMMA|nr:homeobox protein SMOX-3-like [Bombyx mandarina]